MGAGMYGLNDLNPMTSIHIWEIYTTPVLLHSLEVLILKQSEVEKLEDFYRANLRRMQHLPASCANAAAYLLLVALPVEGQIHKRILIFLVNMLHRENSIEREIIERQLAIKAAGSYSWVMIANQMLQKYGLLDAHSLLKNLPSKGVWKTMVTKQVHDHWERKLKEEAAGKKTLSYFSLDSCKIGKPHSAWTRCKSDKSSVYKDTIQAKLLVQRYNLLGGTTRNC